MTATLKSLLLKGQQQLANSSDSPRLDAEVLLGHVLQANRAHLYANPDREIVATTQAAYAQLLNERHTGRPVAHLTGQREFWSLPFAVSPEVLSPRPETELLVEQALKHIPADQVCEVLDLGCGSGAIAIAIARERTLCKVTATDISKDALNIARDNAASNQCEHICFLEGRWFNAVGPQHFDVIVSNPPYIAIDEAELTDPELAYEPKLALYSGADGLDDIRLIINEAPAHLHPAGVMLLEHGFNQADGIASLFAQQNFAAIRTHADLAAQPRVTEARLDTQE
jgi:release factor glutamine methyltransferase